jgi:hypothetical protein
MLQKWLPAAAVAAALLLSACGSVRISRIIADPAHYRHRTVTVTGTVTNAVGVLGTGGYQIEDGTGMLFVVSRSGVPARGARVKVTGTVQSGVNILGTQVGTALREQRHKLAR